MKIDQHLIREYLLDPRSSAVEEFEELLFADESLYVAVQEEQESLIEDFVKGQLSKADSQRFQQQCDLSPELNEKVAEFRLLFGALERHTPRENAGRAAGFKYGWQIRGLAASLACVACLLLVWVMFVRPRKSSDTSAAKPAISNDRQVAESQEPSVGPEMTFFLADGATRGPSSRTQLKIMSDTSKLQLQLELRGSSASIPSWSVAVLHGTEQVWRSDDIQTQRIGDEVFLAAHVPTASMPDGIYTVQMTPLHSERAPLSRDFSLERAK